METHRHRCTDKNQALILLLNIALVQNAKQRKQDNKLWERQLPVYTMEAKKTGTTKKKTSIQVIQMKRTAAPGRSVKSQSPQTKKYLNHPS